MTFRTRLMLVAAVVALPVLSACSESPTAPGQVEAKIRRDGIDSTSLVGCGDYVPWGIAPCVMK